VIRQDAGAGSALAAQAPGGLRSPQLSTLLDQLQWITLAGKPTTSSCAWSRKVNAQPTRLSSACRSLEWRGDPAQAGLNDSKTRQQLDPAAREAYLELLRSTEVSKLDRGDTKSVRLILEITPRFLAAARTATPSLPNATPGKPVPQEVPPTKRGAPSRGILRA